jgi:DNA repair photolyase
MTEDRLLFDLPAKPPTTRTIALTVKLGGSSALDQAQRRADDARYQEVTCRSALNPVKGMPFNWTLNPYRGCTHGCHYCFARRYQTQFELGPGDEFSSLIFVKTNLVEVLRREVDKPSWKRELVAIGTATDPYQPIEGHYKLTRRSLEVLLQGRTPIAIVTKGPMVVRDVDLLVEIGRSTDCSVCLSVPTIDEDAWSTLEPGTAHPLQRLRAVRTLRKAGVNAGVLMSPMVPGFTTERKRLEATIRAIADHDAAFLGANVLFLKGGTRDHFMGFLRQEFPHLVEGYERLYPGAYASKEYARAVKSLVQALQDRYDVGRRRRLSSGGDEEDREATEGKDKDKDERDGDSRDAEQTNFDWKR